MLQLVGWGKGTRKIGNAHLAPVFHMQEEGELHDDPWLHHPSAVLPQLGPAWSGLLHLAP